MCVCVWAQLEKNHFWFCSIQRFGFIKYFLSEKKPIWIRKIKQNFTEHPFRSLRIATPRLAWKLFQLKFCERFVWSLKTTFYSNTLSDLTGFKIFIMLIAFGRYKIFFHKNNHLSIYKNNRNVRGKKPIKLKSGPEIFIRFTKAPVGKLTLGQQVHVYSLL